MTAMASLVPRRMTLDEILDIFERDKATHMTGGPAGEQELLELEQAIGRPLPASLRTFLGRLGGGLFYQGHEIFGPQRVMIHDIELVPSLTTMRRRLAGQSEEGLLPFHRAEGLVHLLDLRPEARPPGRIVSLPYGATYTDLAAFLEAVVLPRPPGRERA